MKKVLTVLVIGASITRGGALIVTAKDHADKFMIRSSERIALGITIPQQAMNRTIKITVDESKEKTPTGLTFCEIDATMINDAAATRLEVVRVYQTALRQDNNKQASDDQTSGEPVLTPKPGETVTTTNAGATEQPAKEEVVSA